MSVVEEIVRSFIVDESLQREVAALEAAGWQMKVKPVMVYHLWREVKQEAQVHKELPPELQANFGPGKLLINDNLIGIYGPDGKPKR